VLAETSRNLAEQAAALSASETRWLAYIEQANDLVFSLDRDGRLATVNRATCEALGYKAAELIGRVPVDFVPPEGRAAAADALARLVSGSWLQYIDLTVVTRDGRRVLLEVRGRLLQDDAAPAGSMLIARDVTARRKAETDFACSHAMLSAISRAQTRLIHHAGRDEVFGSLVRDVLAITESAFGFVAELGAGPDGTPCVLSFLPSESTWKYSTQTFRDACAAPGRRSATLPDVLADAARTQRVVILNDAPGSGDAARPPDGHPVVENLIVVPCLNGDTLVGLIGLANRRGGFDREIAELLAPAAITCANMFEAIRERQRHERAEEERRRLATQMQHAQKLESLGVLAGGVAHDFNNLLMVMLGNVDLALDGLPPRAAARESLVEVGVAGRRAAELTRQMLAYSGKGKFLTQPVDLSELIRSTSEMLRVAVSKNASLRFNLASSLPPVDGDPAQLQQVILNLAVNASEAIGERSGVIALITAAKHRSGADLSNQWLQSELSDGWYVSLEVTDTGAGMDPDIISRMFDPFFSTKFVGRGLGLAAVLGIVRGHKGAIDVQSSEGQGTTIRIHLPVSARVIDALPAERVAAHIPAGSGTVLIVDDEEGVCVLGKRMLERLGYAVLSAPDGEAGLEAWAAHREHVRCVLLDMVMPRMDGIETFRILRERAPDLPIIVTSGYGESDVAHRFVGQNPSAILLKPYDMRALGEVLHAVLREG
jgi:PAS domain S-box-containing protein